jgi:putative hydroxymethylpyrimidine transport system substrate-binding protein
MDPAGRLGRAFYVEEQGVPAFGELILVRRTELVGVARRRKLLDALALATL